MAEVAISPYNVSPDEVYDHKLNDMSDTLRKARYDVDSNGQHKAIDIELLKKNIHVLDDNKIKNKNHHKKQLSKQLIGSNSEKDIKQERLYDAYTTHNNRLFLKSAPSGTRNHGMNNNNNNNNNDNRKSNSANTNRLPRSLVEQFRKKFEDAVKYNDMSLQRNESPERGKGLRSSYTPQRFHTSLNNQIMSLEKSPSVVTYLTSKPHLIPSHITNNNIHNYEKRSDFIFPSPTNTNNSSINTTTTTFKDSYRNNNIEIDKSFINPNNDLDDNNINDKHNKKRNSLDFLEIPLFTSRTPRKQGLISMKDLLKLVLEWDETKNILDKGLKDKIVLEIDIRG
jgi:hypothetical protein